VCCGCNLVQKQINVFKEVQETTPYIFVHLNGYTKNNEVYYYYKIARKNLRKEKVRLYNSSTYIEEVVAIGEKIFFTYEYYNKKYPKEMKKIALGCIDVYTDEVKFLKYYENENPILMTFSNNVAIIDENYCTAYSIDFEKVLSIKISNYDLLKTKAVNNGLVFKSKEENKILIIDKEINVYYLDIEDYNNLKYLYLNDCYILFYDDNTEEYLGYNYKNEEVIDSKNLKLIIDDYIKYSEDRNYGFLNGSKYYYNIYSDNIEVKDLYYVDIFNDNFNRTINLDDVRGKEEKVKKAEELFAKELHFKEVFIADEIYITLVNDDTFFGFYSFGNQTFTLVLKYDLLNDTFTYIGFYGSTKGKLINVLKIE